jgi:hypothetical protein
MLQRTVWVVCGPKQDEKGQQPPLPAEKGGGGKGHQRRQSLGMEDEEQKERDREREREIGGGSIG